MLCYIYIADSHTFSLYCQTVMYGIVVLAALIVAGVRSARIPTTNNGEQKAQGSESQGTIYENGVAVSAITVQKNNIYDLDNNAQNVYGSTIRRKTEIYDSPDSQRPSKVETETIVAPGGPGKPQVSWATSGSGFQKGLPNQNGLPTNNILGAITSQTNNIYRGNPGAQVSFGSIVEITNRVNGSGKGNNQSQSHGSQGFQNSGRIHFGSQYYGSDNSYHFSPNGTHIAGAVLLEEDNVYNFGPRYRKQNTATPTPETPETPIPKYQKRWRVMKEQLRSIRSTQQETEDSVRRCLHITCISML